MDKVQSQNNFAKTDHWSKFKKNIIGDKLTFVNEHGKHDVIYADWIASGRLYKPIEEAISQRIGSVVSNPHSYSSYTGAVITSLYEEARQNIKNHVNANADDILVAIGSGMTDALMRLQKILALEERRDKQKPVVFISHMEHHSNHVSWMECACDVVIVPSNDDNLVDPNNLKIELGKYKERTLKIGAFSACSNVTGIINPIHELARIMHEVDGYCFADYAASAPYVDIDMHPGDPEESLDAIYFSPHKFLGGPGSCGILIFNKSLHSGIPNIPGGGNVRWTDPWGGYGYTNDIETQEDGGTPAFLQTIKASMAITLKEKMDTKRMQEREKELLQFACDQLRLIEKVELLCDGYQGDRIGSLAFNITGLHYNLAVLLLNDRFGIQTRGGWSCASTYAHTLFDIGQHKSKKIMGQINSYDTTNKPGWVRLSLHPTMTDRELEYCIHAIRQVSINGEEWGKEFLYNSVTNEFDEIEKTNNSPEKALDILFTFDD